KDASYFDLHFQTTGDAEPRSAADDQIKDKDGSHDENDDTKKSNDDSSLKDDGTANQQVNTASPEVNTGSKEVSTAFPEVNIAPPEDLVGPSHASEDTQVESFNDQNDQEVELGNIPHSYAVPTTPNIRIHKDHPVEHEEPKRISKALSDLAWVEAMQEELLQFKFQKIEEEVYVCQPLGFEDPDHPDKVHKVVKALYGLHQAPRAWYDTLANYLLSNGFQRRKIDQTLFIKRQKGHILLVHSNICRKTILGSQRRNYVMRFIEAYQNKFSNEFLRGRGGKNLPSFEIQDLTERERGILYHPKINM
ncbi:putative ribonuclease H-like domain-containing protein, partial [Tanacetum coccineum]